MCVRARSCVYTCTRVYVWTANITLIDVTRKVSQEQTLGPLSVQEEVNAGSGKESVPNKQPTASNIGKRKTMQLILRK